MTVMSETLMSVSVAALVTAVVSKIENEQRYVLVVGLGVTGLSVVRHLKNQGEEVVVIDSRTQPPGMDALRENYPDVSVYTGDFDEALFMGAARIIVSPGVPLSEPAIQHGIQQGVEVLGDVELFAREVKAPVIAITGSNGKSTVTMLVGEMAKQAGLNVAVGGNIGVPVLDLLNQNVDLYVLELSSFQLETCQSLKPVASTVLNVSPDHMDRYADFDAYTKVKQAIYKQCKVSVINRDDEKVKTMTTGQRFISGFTLHEPAIGDFGLREFNGETYLCKGGQKLIAESEVKLSGRHNIANALAALALCEAANISIEDMLQALREFGGLPHRTQWIANKQNVDWYNDSKGTNVGATLAAIEGLVAKNKIILIAGGIAKDADFSLLKKSVKEKVRLVVLIGRDAPQIEQALQGVVPVMYAKDMNDAIHISADLAHIGDSVLLSPACASFDMFRGFEHRGEVFAEAVGSLS
jgi:UDP-N-acetylmuramoylalanine--D-glutamate ligase